jgi:hypothetical protein
MAAVLLGIFAITNLHIQPVTRSSFEHAPEGSSQDLPTVPRPGTNSHGTTAGACEDTQPAQPVVVAGTCLRNAHCG